jgi:electron transport complex protein RnfC
MRHRASIVLDDRGAVGIGGASCAWSPRAATLKTISLENDYPQADPTLLLYTLLGRRLRPGRLPVEQGVLMLDAAAAIAIGAAALADEAMQRVPMVLRDHDRGESFFLTVPVGCTVGSVLSILRPQLQAGADTSGFLLRAGDVLRDDQVTLDAVLGTSELVVHLSTTPPAVNPQPCIRCGWCYESCPTRVQPADVLEAAQRDDRELAERAGLESCIECGICAYVCPSKLPLLAGIRTIRKRRSSPTVIHRTVVHTDHNGDAGAVEARVVAARRGSGAVGVLRCPSESYASTANIRSSLLIAASVTEVA